MWSIKYEDVYIGFKKYEKTFDVVYRHITTRNKLILKGMNNHGIGV